MRFLSILGEELEWQLREEILLALLMAYSRRDGKFNAVVVNLFLLDGSETVPHDTAWHNLATARQKTPQTGRFAP